MLKKLNNIGDAAIACDFGDEVNQAVNNEVIKLFHYLTKQASLNILPGILTCTPSYNKLLISFDLKQTNSKQVCDFVNSIDLTNLKLDQKRKKWIIPICYAYELDLTNMVKELKLSKEEIINYHLNMVVDDEEPDAEGLANQLLSVAQQIADMLGQGSAVSSMEDEEEEIVGEESWPGKRDADQHKSDLSESQIRRIVRKVLKETKKKGS